MKKSRPLTFAILGTRGVPPRYGGFETFAGELSRRLVARGHRVIVYCRRSLYRNEPREWFGVERVELPAVGHKYLETVSHAFVSAVDVIRRAPDAVLLCNAANAFVLPVLRAARIPVAVNVDGIERNRRKWNALGRAVYKAGESMSARFADTVVADADVIAGYYARAHAVSSVVIPYGADFPDEPDSDVLSRFGLRPREYVLYVSRFEPENNPLGVVREYARVRTGLPLVMVGDAPYSAGLIRAAREEADSRVVFTGGVYDRDYRTLQRNALVYIQATEVGGTHPALIEAMRNGGAVLAHGTPENREVGGNTVSYFDIHSSGDLAQKLQIALDDPAALSVFRERAKARAASNYDWNVVTDRYEHLLIDLSRE